MPASQTLLFPDPRPLVERLGSDFFRQLPERPGVYLMQDATEVVLYVGKAKSLRQRLGHYRVANPDRMGRRHLRLLRQVVRIQLLECADESAALAKEAELLLALKPKFNRAGVWVGPARFLIWRRAGKHLELATTKTPAAHWQQVGPFGSSVVYLRAALVRLLWYALNPSLGSQSMPAGWWHGRLGNIASLEACSDELEMILAKSFSGDTDTFATWIAERTKSLAHAHDREMRDADLETVVTLIQAKARRTLLPFHTSARSNRIPNQLQTLDTMTLFQDEDWTES